MALISTLQPFQDLAQTIQNGADAVDNLDPANVPANVLTTLQNFTNKLVARANVLGSYDYDSADGDALAAALSNLNEVQNRLAEAIVERNAYADRLAQARQELRLVNPRDPDINPSDPVEQLP